MPKSYYICSTLYVYLLYLLRQQTIAAQRTPCAHQPHPSPDDERTSHVSGLAPTACDQKGIFLVSLSYTRKLQQQPSPSCAPSDRRISSAGMSLACISSHTW